MSYSGSSAVNRIMDAQMLVSNAENGEIEWATLFPLITRPALSDLEDVYEFVGEMYFNVRLVEAIAYKFRDQRDKDQFESVLNLVEWARTQRKTIEDQLIVNSSYEPENGLEGLGVMFVEEKCRWALRLIDETFASWGY